MRQYQERSIEDKINLGVSYWQEVSLYMEDWKRIKQGSLTLEEIRDNYLSGQGIILTALGKVGQLLLETYPDHWQEKLSQLKRVDWLLSETSVDLDEIITYLLGYLD